MLVGITGSAGAGKDTIADHLVTQYGFIKISFARPIKDMLCTLLGVPLSKWNDREWKETPFPGIEVTPRYMAQSLGTEWGRNCISKNIWVEMALRKAEEDHGRADVGIVISDVRFDNEANLIYERGGANIAVHREDSPTLATADHSSEGGVHPELISYNIHNDGTIDALRSNADIFLEWNRRRLVA